MAAQQELGLLPQPGFGIGVVDLDISDARRSHLTHHHPRKLHMNKQIRHLCLLAPVLLLCLNGCNKPGPAQEAGRQLDETATHSAQAVQKTLDKAQASAQAESKKLDLRASDADITAKVKMALMMRDGLNSLTISVKTKAGVVTLSGSVANASQSLLAQKLAMAVEDVLHVDNHLSVVAATQ